MLRFFDIGNWKNPVAITLTMKQGRFFDRTFVELTPGLCSQNLRHFRNVLNRKAFKNASHKKKMKCVAVLSNRRMAATTIISPWTDLSASMTSAFASWSIRSGATPIGREQTAYELPADQGWISYMIKLKTKP